MESSRALRILVIAASADAAGACRAVFSRAAGFELAVQANVDSALAHLDFAPWDAVLVDPERPGAETRAIVARLNQASSVPVVVCGGCSASDAARCRRLAIGAARGPAAGSRPLPGANSGPPTSPFAAAGIRAEGAPLPPSPRTGVGPRPGQMPGVGRPGATTGAHPRPHPTTTVGPRPTRTTTVGSRAIPTTTVAPRPVPTTTVGPRPIPTMIVSPLPEAWSSEPWARPPTDRPPEPVGRPLTTRAPRPAVHPPDPRTPSGRLRRGARIDLVVIGSSTGGPGALSQILRLLPPGAPPIVIAQHLLAGFSESLAAQLDLLGPVRVREAYHGAPLTPGVALIAPTGFHTRVTTGRGGLVIALSPGGPDDRHLPGIDVLFHSVAPMGPRCMGLLLTGMGSDGAEGLLAMRQAGAVTLVQDEASSTVFGMAARAIEIGAAAHVGPPTMLATAISRLARASIHGAP